MPAYKATIDATLYSPREKHSVIIGVFDDLASQEAMELVNDHDPKPLYYQFQAVYGDTFAWKYLVSGPEEWRVVITKK